MRPYFWGALGLLGAAACSTQKPAQHPDPNASGYDGSMVPAAALTSTPDPDSDAPEVAPQPIAEADPETDDATPWVAQKDQGKSHADLITTQRIREAVIMNESLSFSATEIQILTSEGKVTLRGTVKSARESAMIEDIAKEIAGPYNVDNKLEIK